MTETIAISYVAIPCLTRRCLFITTKIPNQTKRLFHYKVPQYPLEIIAMTLHGCFR